MSGSSSTSKYSMPVIGLPTSGSDSAAHYNAATGGDLQVEAASNEGVKISLPDNADKKLYAMVKGFVTFIPAGDPLPTLGQEPSPGEGSILLQTGVAELTNLKTELRFLTGASPMAHILYLNVHQDSLRNAIRPYVQVLTEAILEQAWTHLGLAVPTYSNKTGLAEKYLDLVMQSKVNVEVDGGSLIGVASPKDLSDPSLGVEFILRFLDTSGNDLSPILHIRNLPAYGGSEWEEHPLIDKVSSISVPVDIYLKFEIWEKGTGNYVPLPTDIDVDIKDYDLLPPDDLLGTRKTDSNGCVHFSSSDDPVDPNKKGIPELLEAGHDIYFVVRTDGTETHAGHTLPEEWSTMDWLDVFGHSGYYKDFAGGQLGELNEPMVFRVGVDYHFKFTYFDKNASTDRPAPKGVKVQFFKHGGGLSFHEDYTDEKGEIHGISFDIELKDSVYLRIPFQIEDSSINLPLAQVETSEIFWDTNKMDADHKEFIDIRNPNLGVYEHPEVFHASIKDRHSAFYIMKVLREWSSFLFHITGGNWTGIHDLKIMPMLPDLSPPSWYPSGWPWVPQPRPFAVPGVGIFLEADNKCDRMTIIHELSHLIMYKESLISIAEIGTMFAQGGPDGYMQNHNTFVITNEFTALMEGWAQFIELVFSNRNFYDFHNYATSGDHCATNNTLEVEDRVAENNVQLCSPKNRGQKVEGAFANVLYKIFVDYVLKTGSAYIAETTDGNQTTSSSWGGNSQDFKEMIWWPLQDISSDAEKSTTGMISHIRNRTHSIPPPVWYKIHSEFQKLNMAMDTPVFDATNPITPKEGPITGGQTITIKGDHFTNRIIVAVI